MVKPGSDMMKKLVASPMMNLARLIHVSVVPILE